MILAILFSRHYGLESFLIYRGVCLLVLFPLWLTSILFFFVEHLVRVDLYFQSLLVFQVSLVFGERVSSEHELLQRFLPVLTQQVLPILLLGGDGT